MATDAPPTSLERAGPDAYRFRGWTVNDLLRAFAAGREVPGSGSANALAAALAACLVGSVAIKTHRAPGTKYVHVQQTALDIERRAARIVDRLLDLFEEDSAAFAPVIGLRRETGRIDDPIRQDAVTRAELAALKPATEIPLQIARLAIETAKLALSMLDSGYRAARGESYTALTQSIAALDGAIVVAQVNIGTVRYRVAKLNDPGLEKDWLKRMIRDVRAVRKEWQRLRTLEDEVRNASDDEIFKRKVARRRRRV